MKKNKILWLFMGVLFVCLLPHYTYAMSVTLNDIGLGQDINYIYNGSTGSWAGQFYVNANGGNYLAFCVDLDAWISPGTPYNTTTLPVTANYFSAAWLVGQFGATVTTNAEAAALQAAIWETIYGAQFTLDPNSSVYALYVNYLSQIPSNIPESNFSLFDLENSQMLIVMVPEPNIMLVIGSLLVIFGIYNKVRSRRCLQTIKEV